MNGEQNRIRLTVTEPGNIQTTLDYDDHGKLSFVFQNGETLSIDAKLVYQFLQFIYAE